MTLKEELCGLFNIWFKRSGPWIKSGVTDGWGDKKEMDRLAPNPSRIDHAFAFQQTFIHVLEVPMVDQQRNDA